MATFLELAQGVSRESGTISGVLPTTVANQTDRLLAIVNWTREAWNRIQNEQANWRWMQGEFEADTIAAQQRYTAAAWNLSRWAEWTCSDEQTEDRWSLFRKDLGRADEGYVYFLPWDLFYRSQTRGVPQQGRPHYFTISPAGEVVFSPTPDAAYTVRALYRKTPQVLTEDGDIPECPARFHTIITWRALILLAEFDEAVTQSQAWMFNYREILSNLQRDQLPKPSIGAWSMA